VPDDFAVASAQAQRIELTLCGELGESFSHAILTHELCMRVNGCECVQCPRVQQYVERMKRVMVDAGLVAE
jgi:hypothetical protein